MGGLREYFPVHVWALLFVLLGIAALGLFVPPSVGESAGLTAEEYILLVGAIELGAALGVAVIVIYYRDPHREPSEWRFGP
jgi:hypothetical protein